MQLFPVFSSNAEPDVIETYVTNEVDALGLWSRSGLGSVAAGSQTALEPHFATRAGSSFANRAGSSFANREVAGRHRTAGIH